MTTDHKDDFETANPQHRLDVYLCSQCGSEASASSKVRCSDCGCPMTAVAQGGAMR